MTTLASDPYWGWGWAFIVLAALAVVLFLLATWSGRWSMWLAGYLCAVLALAAAVAGGLERASHEPDRGSNGPVPYDAAAQPSLVSGVWHGVNPSDRRAWRESHEAT